MKLNNGTDVEVIAQVQIGNSVQLVCKLPNASYINGILVSYIVLNQHEFKELSDKISAESAELVVVNDDTSEVENVMDRGAVLETNIESPPEIQAEE